MPLQKTLSDQSHLSKNRSGWQRNKTYSAPSSRNSSTTSKSTTATATEVSSKALNKPAMFKSVANEARPSTLPPPKRKVSHDEVDKENFGQEARDPKRKQSKTPSRSSQDAPKGSQTDSKTPATPAARLALPDLVGFSKNPHTANNSESPPEEQPTWAYDKNAVQSSGGSAARNRNGKKRARSSSPTSSSPARVDAQLSRGRAFDLQQLEGNIPPADPGSELWGRFAQNSQAKVMPTGRRSAALVQLMQTTSPKQNREWTAPRSESKLRRAISCGGIPFPSNKRRKIVAAGESVGEEVFGESVGVERSKGSIINALIENFVIPKSCGANTITTRGYSPVLEVENLPLSRAASVIDEPQPQSGELVVGSNDIERIVELESIPKVDSIPADAENETISDYGDFDDEDLDEEALMVIEGKATVPAVSQEKSKPGSSTTLVADDEFGESDEELLDADMADLASKFDTEGAVVTEAKVVDTRQPSQSIGKSHVDSDDEFDEDIDDADFEVAEAAASQSIPLGTMPSSSQKVRAIQRYLVTHIRDNEYKTPEGKTRPERILLVEGENTNITRCVQLRDGWLDTPVSLRAYVHIIGDFKANACIIDDKSNMIILHPDHLISSTHVADSFGCLRRAVLQDRVKATNESSAPLVYGTVLHEIFQAAMMENKWNTEFLTGIIESISTKHLEDLYVIKLEIPQAVEYLKSKMPELQAWAELFVSSKPKSDALVKAGNSTSAAMCVSKLLDVEEHVWSPMYGLKGNIDATVQVTMKDGKEERTLTVPFEVKTGKSVNASHRAQTALYNLLLSDRYDIEIAYGILYYMETSETIRLPTIRHELRHMIMQRNELACYVRQRDAQLPPMLKKESLCNRCYAKVPCFIYHKMAEDGTGETSGLKDKFEEIVQHLTPKHKEFFLKWDDLLTKEEKESLKFRRELWTMLSSEREKLGRCFSNVIIKPGSAFEEQGNPKINRFRYTLIKQNPAPGFSFVDSQITLGEPIVISDEKGHFALANGYVTHVRKHQITVAVDRRLHNARIRQAGFDEINNQLFASIMDVTPEGFKSPEKISGETTEPVLYRLDKDEFSNGMAKVRNNIIQVMMEGPFGSREIRSLVVDLKAPRFKVQSSSYTLTGRESINVDQRRAIDKVMSAQDYALVLGMPGTGKTTTIAHIIRALVSQGKSVLLTSYTHTAVDNILLKLKDDNIPIFRLGTIAKVSTDVQKFATMDATPKTSFQEIRSAWHDSPVVATTCLGINHPIFNERIFDYCIVDEASQITLPVCLGPIRMARTFVLVGDHNQLPPLVQNEEARVGGLDISLFKHLSDVHPSSVVNLEHQYRMCADVMSLSNKLIYDNRLKCGTSEVANRSIVIPNINALEIHHYTASNLPANVKTICARPAPNQCWLRDLIDPATKVSFINTDTLLPLSREEAKGSRTVNPTEVTICTQLVESLLTTGVPASSIGVMTHYRSQLALLKHSLAKHPEVEMHTADRFQGRDKEIIILSLVRSNEAKNIGDLLKDWRRINVAFTRAKTKLLVIGSRETLKGNVSNGVNNTGNVNGKIAVANRGVSVPVAGNGNGSEEMVSKFVSFMEAKGWIYDLPKGALDSHHFSQHPFSTQQSTSTANTSSTQWKPVASNTGSTTMKPKNAPVQRNIIDDLKQARGMNGGVLFKGKENQGGPRRVGAGEKVVLGGNPVMRDVMRDLVGN